MSAATTSASPAPVAGSSTAAATGAGSASPAPPKKDEDAEMADGTKEEGADTEELPADANEVLYINNLNERIKLKVMKQSLKVLFKEYGSVYDVTAHSNIRMRGQAFVTLDSKQAAAKAVKEVKGFPLYGKPMQLGFARTRSDALVNKQAPDELEEHKKARLERKKIARKENPLRRKYLAQKQAAKKAAAAAAASGQAAPTPATAATQARRIVQMPDEYLPPNKILFVQNLPDDTTKETLEALFRPYPNLSEVRTIPGRKNIAFVEFTDDVSSGAARDALHNTKLGEGEAALKLKVTFAKLG